MNSLPKLKNQEMKRRFRGMKRNRELITVRQALYFQNNQKCETINSYALGQFV